MKSGVKFSSIGWCTLSKLNLSYFIIIQSQLENSIIIITTAISTIINYHNNNNDVTNIYTYNTEGRYI